VAHIEDRWFKQEDGRRVRTELYGKGQRYRVRYIGPDGRERSKSFPDREKGKAEAFKATLEADMLRGTYIDPDAGRMSLRTFATEWLAGQTLEETTREAMESRFRVHVYPHLGDKELRAISPSVVRSWDWPCSSRGSRLPTAECCSPICRRCSPLRSTTRRSGRTLAAPTR
jgi:hypothetical protein